MGEIGIIPSQIREQNPLLAQEVSGNIPGNHILIVKRSLGDLLTKGIDDLASAPELECFFLRRPDTIFRGAYLGRLNG